MPGRTVSIRTLQEEMLATTQERVALDLVISQAGMIKREEVELFYSQLLEYQSIVYRLEMALAKDDATRTKARESFIQIAKDNRERSAERVKVGIEGPVVIFEADARWYALQAELASTPAKRLEFQKERADAANQALKRLEELLATGSIRRESFANAYARQFKLLEELRDAQSASLDDPSERKKALQQILDRSKQLDAQIQSRVKLGDLNPSHGYQSTIRILQAEASLEADPKQKRRIQQAVVENAVKGLEWVQQVIANGHVSYFQTEAFLLHCNNLQQDYIRAKLEISNDPETKLAIYKANLATATASEVVYRQRNKIGDLRKQLVLTATYNRLYAELQLAKATTN